jgi:hypothetical protein
MTGTPAEIDPWEPEDSDELPDPATMVAYSKAENQSPAAQQRLVGDQWRLWRLARDMASALEDLLDPVDDQCPRDPGLACSGTEPR